VVNDAHHGALQVGSHVAVADAAAVDAVSHSLAYYVRRARIVGDCVKAGGFHSSIDVNHVLRTVEAK
jgi:hypothetical protein